MGCRILVEALSGRGSFEARLGRYHSRSPERGRWYARRVLAAVRELEAERCEMKRNVGFWLYGLLIAFSISVLGLSSG